jgi:LuxR family transcriptional regulator
MNQGTELGQIIASLRDEFPVGFAIALHIKFTAPAYLLQAYSHDWTERYTREGMLMRDPSVRWGLSNIGSIRWEDLPDMDDAGAEVMKAAAEHGLRHGFTVTVGSPSLRSFGGFARDDRRATDAEIQSAEMRLTELHELTSDAPTLTPAFHEQLRSLSVDLTRN